MTKARGGALFRACSRRTGPIRPPSSTSSIPIRLLVAVVLSAQATDVSVNKATEPLFKVADTPAEDAGAGRGAAHRLHPHDRPVPHQGQERHRPVAPPGREAWRQGAGRRARRSRRCPASDARPRMWCSMSPSASRPSPSTRTSSASATAPASRPARRRSQVEDGLERIVPDALSSAAPITGSSCTGAMSASRASRAARPASCARCAPIRPRRRANASAPAPSTSFIP